MAIKGFRLQNADLTLLEPGVGESYAITTVMVCNNSSTDSATFSMHLVANGDPIADGTTPGINNSRVINNLTLAPEETFTFDTEKIVLAEGDRLVIFAEPAVDTYQAQPNDPVLNLTNLGAVVSYLEV